jgi:Icc-related predicted phosphoesterase
MNNPYIFVSHDIPFIDNIYFNPQKYGNKQYTKLINKYKPTINIFGHCHMIQPMTIINNTLYLHP